jgi:glycerate 2-kinase
MRKVVIIPDSFKGTLSSIEVASILDEALKSVDSACQSRLIPISDGGEGFIDCFLSVLPGRKISVPCHDPFGRMIKGYYALLDNNIAVIELAVAAGLSLVADALDPSTASTFGVGELIRHAVSNPVDKIYLGIGGSATNDAGTGLCQALGHRFLDKEGLSFSPAGRNLDRICDIDSSLALKTPEIITFTDVRNPLFGFNGAAYVYAPQKGANPEMVQLLDQQLRAYSRFLAAKYGFNSDFPGAGAAGGSSVSLKCLLGASIESGIDSLLDLIGFDEIIKKADLVVTGEGRMDRQSLQGKVISGIAKRCAIEQVPLIAINGQISDVPPEMYPLGLTAAYSVVSGQITAIEAMKHPKLHLKSAAIRIFDALTKDPL